MAKFRCKVGDVVLVEWTDSTQQDGWQKVDEIDGAPSSSMSVGIVLELRTEYLVIAGDYSGDSTDANRIMTIPIGCISTLEILKRFTKKTKATVRRK